jgi:predicted nucleic acid-binding protein
MGTRPPGPPRLFSILWERLYAATICGSRWNATAPSPCDATQGYARKTGLEALAKVQSNLDAGALVLVAAEWADVINIAERISAQHTIGGGHRFLDGLHVATARHFGATEFLSCDANQRKLAATEGFAVRP